MTKSTYLPNKSRINLGFVSGTLITLASYLLPYPRGLVKQAVAATPQAVPTLDEAVGEIAVPPGTEQITGASGADIGIIFFLSNLLVIMTVVAGIWSLFNILLAGLQYIGSSGDAGTHEKARTYITNSVIGLILVAITYMMGGLIGFIFFGDAGFLLNPVLPSPGNP